MAMSAGGTHEAKTKVWTRCLLLEDDDDAGFLLRFVVVVVVVVVVDDVAGGTRPGARRCKEGVAILNDDTDSDCTSTRASGGSGEGDSSSADFCAAGARARREAERGLSFILSLTNRCPCNSVYRYTATLPFGSSE